MRACAEGIKQKLGLKGGKLQFENGGRKKIQGWGIFIFEKLRQKLSSWHVGCSRVGQEALVTP